jgi:Recombination endonuclease VII
VYLHRLRSKDLTARTGVCAACGPVGLLSNGGTLRCENAVREVNLKRMQPHGLTNGEAKRACEGKTCALCGTADDLVIDHDHVTGIRRDVLCRRHNAGLGMFGDDPGMLMLAASYLDRWSKMNDECLQIPALPVFRAPLACLVCLDSSQALTYPGEQSTRHDGAARARAGTMQFQSPEHAQSYRHACKALAHARREAYATVAGMTTAELLRCEPDYLAATGESAASGEALTQLRTVSSELARRGAAS